jgi:hypothetical protein
MILYYVERESDGQPVGETRSVIGVLDLVEEAGPGKYRVHERISPVAGIPKSREGTAMASHEGGYVTYHANTGFLMARSTLERSGAAGAYRPGR